MLCAQSLAGPFIEPGCVIMDGCRGIGFLYLPPTFPPPNLNFALDNFRLDMTYDWIFTYDMNLRKRYSDFKTNKQQQQTTLRWGGGWIYLSTLIRAEDLSFLRFCAIWKSTTNPMLTLSCLHRQECKLLSFLASRTCSNNSLCRNSSCFQISVKILGVNMSPWWWEYILRYKKAAKNKHLYVK